MLHPVPVVLMARLAEGIRHEGTGLGVKTLVYAVREAIALCPTGLPSSGLILDVVN
ncbi:hypothetical protein [Teredinibacter turnerae]|uniref:hypothetical protein n=1 Tax=Teredinibacter turnerae TaxID=2426 RepID=UPI0003776B19|nr:hypothetical protein [Teredinibacter turnerae]